MVEHEEDQHHQNSVGADQGLKNREKGALGGENHLAVFKPERELHVLEQLLLDEGYRPLVLLAG